MQKEILEELIALDSRLLEDRLYEIAVQEIETNDFDAVAKAKAFEEAEGNELKARAFYTRHRVRRIRDQLTAFSIEREIAAAADLQETIEQERNQRKERNKQVGKNLGSALIDEKILVGTCVCRFLAIWSAFGAGPSLSVVFSLASYLLVVRWFIVRGEPKRQNISKSKIGKAESLKNVETNSCPPPTEAYSAISVMLGSVGVFLLLFFLSSL